MVLQVTIDNVGDPFLRHGVWRGELRNSNSEYKSRV